MRNFHCTSYTALPESRSCGKSVLTRRQARARPTFTYGRSFLSDWSKIRTRAPPGLGRHCTQQQKVPADVKRSHVDHSLTVTKVSSLCAAPKVVPTQQHTRLVAVQSLCKPHPSLPSTSRSTINLSTVTDPRWTTTMTRREQTRLRYRSLERRTSAYNFQDTCIFLGLTCTA